MKNLKSLLIGVLALSATYYASTSLAATYTVTVNNKTLCSLRYSIGSGSAQSISAGSTAGLNVPTGQQVNLYMYTSMANSYPVCGYSASTGSIIFYYDSAQKTYIEKVFQGTTISGARPFYQEAILNGTSFTVNAGQTVQKNVETASGVINVTVHGGNIK